MKRIIDRIKMLARDEEGATMVEYGIMVALIAAISIAIIGSIGQRVLGGFTTVDTEMGNAPITAPTTT